MSRDIPERDWKTLRAIKQDLLATLADRINRRALAILSDPAPEPFERYKALRQHLRDSDQIVGECFDDWRRSNLLMNLLALRSHALLTDAHLETLSPQTRDAVTHWEAIANAADT